MATWSDPECLLLAYDPDFVGLGVLDQYGWSQPDSGAVSVAVGGAARPSGLDDSPERGFEDFAANLAKLSAAIELHREASPEFERTIRGEAPSATAASPPAETPPAETPPAETPPAAPGVSIASFIVPAEEGCGSCDEGVLAAAVLLIEVSDSSDSSSDSDDYDDRDDRRQRSRPAGRADNLAVLGGLDAIVVEELEESGPGYMCPACDDEALGETQAGPRAGPPTPADPRAQGILAFTVGVGAPDE